jgi:hypothetical protein
VAAYDWVDIGIGLDTNGSIRMPAECCGVFGLRVSQGVFSHEGMFTVFKRFDVPGIFARDLRVMVDFAMKWYAGRSEGLKTDGLPEKLVYITDHMSAEDTPQKRCVMDLVQDMEVSLGMEAIDMSVEDLWDSDPPEDAHGQGLQDFLKDVSRTASLAPSANERRSAQVPSSTRTTTAAQISAPITAKPTALIRL